MKCTLLGLLALLAGAPAGRAQTLTSSADLYRSAEDFRLHRLSWETPARQAAFRVRLHEWPNRSYITVVHGAHKDTLAKAAVYGYRDHDSRVYRLTGNQRFPVLNSTEEVLLYKVEQPTVGKNPGYVRLYFSASAAAPLQPLTLLNVKRAFPSNYRLHELLDAQFPAGSDLTAWDELHGMTKLNWLLRYSQDVAQRR